MSLGMMEYFKWLEVRTLLNRGSWGGGFIPFRYYTYISLLHTLLLLVDIKFLRKNFICSRNKGRKHSFWKELNLMTVMLISNWIKSNLIMQQYRSEQNFSILLFTINFFVYSFLKVFSYTAFCKKR